MPVSWELVPQLLHPREDLEPHPGRRPVAAKDECQFRGRRPGPEPLALCLTLDKSLSSWPRLFCPEGPCNSKSV